MAFSYVTSDIVSGDATSTTIVPAAVAVSSGDVVVFFSRWEGGGASDSTTITATDSLGGNTWSTPLYSNAGGSSEDQRTAVTWTKATGAGTMTVTGTLSITRGFRRGVVMVFSTPAATVIAADSSSSGSDSQSTSWTAGTVDYVNADLIVADCASYNGVTINTPSGFTAVTSGSLMTAYYQIMSGAASLAINGTYGTADSHAAIGLVLRESGAAAVLTSPTPSGTIGTSTTATIGATTTQNTGTFYIVVDSAANLSGVTAAQIKLGQRNNSTSALSSSNSAISTTTPSSGATGLTGSTLYSYAAVQSNGNGDSNVVTGTFTTAATTYGASINLVNNAGSAYASTSFQWFAMSTYGVTITGNGTTSTNGSGVLAVTGVTTSGSGFLTGRDTSTGLIVFGPTPVTFA